MATVEVRFSASPEHVRTARLIVTAVARRAGVDDVLLDEVRLAVGEACSRAVQLHRRHLPDEPVTVMVDDGAGFSVTVADCVPTHDELAGGLEAMDPAYLLESDESPDLLPLGFGLAVIAGLVDDVTIDRTPSGTRVCMAWAASRMAAGDVATLG